MMPFVKMSTDELKVRAIKKITEMSRADLLTFHDPEIALIAPELLLLDDKKIISDLCSIIKTKGLRCASDLLNLSAGPISKINKQKTFPKGHHREATRRAIERYKINNMGVL
tara:strand:- start:15885 stop:16220 length:336 start_codon:yes stop_codon:yes gene_type:complete